MVLKQNRRTWCNKTNFFNSILVAKGSTNLDSPYAQMIKEKERGLNEMIKNGSDPEYMAKIVLEIINNNAPKLRYWAGKDVEQFMELKKKMSDDDFHNMVKM